MSLHLPRTAAHATAIVLIAAAALSGCGSFQPRAGSTHERIDAELAEGIARR